MLFDLDFLYFLMPKMPYASENHSQAVLVSRDNRFLITDRSTRLDDSFDASGCDFFDIVRKGEEGVRSQSSAVKAIFGLLNSNLDRSHTVV